MSTEKKSHPRTLKKLDNPQRLIDIPPEDVWGRRNIKKTEVLVEIGAGRRFFSIASLR